MSFATSFAFCPPATPLERPTARLFALLVHGREPNIKDLFFVNPVRYIAMTKVDTDYYVVVLEFATCVHTEDLRAHISGHPTPPLYRIVVLQFECFQSQNELFEHSQIMPLCDTATSVFWYNFEGRFHVIPDPRIDFTPNAPPRPVPIGPSSKTPAAPPPRPVPVRPSPQPPAAPRPPTKPKCPRAGMVPPSSYAAALFDSARAKGRE
jgi:hypothetical protein